MQLWGMAERERRGGQFLHVGPTSFQPRSRSFMISITLTTLLLVGRIDGLGEFERGGNLPVGRIGFGDDPAAGGAGPSVAKPVRL